MMPEGSLCVSAAERSVRKPASVTRPSLFQDLATEDFYLHSENL